MLPTPPVGVARDEVVRRGDELLCSEGLAERPQDPWDPVQPLAVDQRRHGEHLEFAVVGPLAELAKERHAVHHRHLEVEHHERRPGEAVEQGEGLLAVPGHGAPVARLLEGVLKRVPHVELVVGEQDVRGRTHGA